MHLRILNKLLEYVYKPLSIFLNKAMNDGCIPENRNVTHVLSIFKKGAKNKNENFWPINLMSAVCELMEYFIKKAPSNKTPLLTKSTNMGIWVVGTSNQLFIRGF